MATSSTNVTFYRGDSFSSYEEGAIYFEESTHCIKVAKSSTTADVYSGVRQASMEDGTLTIINEAGTEYEMKFLPVDTIDSDTYNIVNKKVSVSDKSDSNDEILLSGQQVMVIDHTGNRVGRLTSVMTDGVASMYATNGDILDTDNQPTQYNIISATSGDESEGASLTIQSSFNSGASSISSITTALSILFSKNIAGDESSIQLGFDKDNITSNDISIILTDKEGKKSYYAIRAKDLNNDKTTPAYLATEAYVLAHAGGGSINDEEVSEDSTWSSAKIKEELDKSDNIKYYETKDDWKADTDRAIPCICYIKDLNKILFDDGTPIGEPYDWNFSSDAFSGLGTVSSATTIDGLTILPNTQVTSYRTTVGSTDYTNRLYFSQAGNTTSRGVSFELTGNDDIEIVYQGGGNKTVFNLVSSTGQTIRTFSGTSAQTTSFHYSGNATTACLYPTGGTGYIYEIKLNM